MKREGCIEEGLFEELMWYGGGAARENVPQMTEMLRKGSPQVSFTSVIVSDLGPPC